MLTLEKNSKKKRIDDEIMHKIIDNKLFNLNIIYFFKKLSNFNLYIFIIRSKFKGWKVDFKLGKQCVENIFLNKKKN